MSGRPQAAPELGADRTRPIISGKHRAGQPRRPPLVAGSAVAAEAHFVYQTRIQGPIRSDRIAPGMYAGDAVDLPWKRRIRAVQRIDVIGAQPTESKKKPDGLIQIVVGANRELILSAVRRVIEPVPARIQAVPDIKTVRIRQKSNQRRHTGVDSLTTRIVAQDVKLLNTRASRLCPAEQTGTSRGRQHAPVANHLRVRAHSLKSPEQEGAIVDQRSTQRAPEDVLNKLRPLSS